ncbi:MAG: gamma-glutamylcyclotransferase family protein [Bacteroidota bacterium]
MEVFFYGLFMDQEILERNGIQPTNPRKAHLDDYTLKIGNRASLVPSLGKRAYGVVMSVDQAAIDRLYAEASVADYIPETVKVITSKRQTVMATCYNLPMNLLTGTNTKYATSLLQLAQKLSFPADYLETIKDMTGDQV